MLREAQEYRRRYEAPKAEMAPSGHAIGRIGDRGATRCSPLIPSTATRCSRPGSSVGTRCGASPSASARPAPYWPSWRRYWLRPSPLRVSAWRPDHRAARSPGSARARPRHPARSHRLALPLRPSGPLDETAQHALEAIGDQAQDLDRRAFGGRDYREGDEEGALDRQ